MVKEYLTTESRVYHMEPDLDINANIMFSEEGIALKTTDGKESRTIIGNTTAIVQSNDDDDGGDGDDVKNVLQSLLAVSLN